MAFYFNAIGHLIVQINSSKFILSHFIEEKRRSVSSEYISIHFSLLLLVGWLKTEFIEIHEIPSCPKIKGINICRKERKRPLVASILSASKILNDVNVEINYYIWTAGHAFNDGHTIVSMKMEIKNLRD